jgi:hypothetical protein
VLKEKKIKENTQKYKKKFKLILDNQNKVLGQSHDSVG